MQLQHIQIALFPEQPFAPQWTLLNTQLNEHFQLSGNTQLLSIENLPADFPRITAENDDMAFIFSAEKLSVYWKARENTLPGGILEDLRTILDILRQLAPEARYWRMGYIAAFSYATPNPHEFIFEHFYGDTVRDVEGFSRESDMATVTFRRSYEELQNVDINTFFKFTAGERNVAIEFDMNTTPSANNRERVTHFTRREIRQFFEIAQEEINRENFSRYFAIDELSAEGA